MKIKTGSRRIVFIFKNKVVKIPKFTSWLSFILGVMENLHERYWWCADGHVRASTEWYSGSCDHLAKIYWADRFGLCVVMERVNTLDHLEEPYQTCTDLEFLRCKTILENRYKGLDIVNDIRPSNIGYCKDGRIVFADYGYFSGGNSSYLGRKVI